MEVKTSKNQWLEVKDGEVVEKEKNMPKAEKVPSKATNEDGFTCVKWKSSFFKGKGNYNGTQHGR